jgi:hypothetical protein
MNIYKHHLTLWTQLDDAGIREKLDELRRVTVLLDVDKTHAVAQARKLGLSWEQISRELNVSKQAAWERWHHLDPNDLDPDTDYAAL